MLCGELFSRRELSICGDFMHSCLRIAVLERVSLLAAQLALIDYFDLAVHLWSHLENVVLLAKRYGRV